MKSKIELLKELDNRIYKERLYHIMELTNINSSNCDELFNKYYHLIEDTSIHLDNLKIESNYQNKEQMDLNNKIIESYNKLNKFYNTQDFAYNYVKYLELIYKSQNNDDKILEQTLNNFILFYKLLIFNPLIKNYINYIKKCNKFIYKLIQQPNNTDDTLIYINELLKDNCKSIKIDYLSLFEGIQNKRLIELSEELKKNPNNNQIYIKIYNYCEIFLTF